MKTKVLILDDHNGVRESVIIALSQIDNRFDFLQAADTDSALEVLSKNPDCTTMILDMKLKNENGLDALERIRIVRPEIKTLVWTMCWEPANVLEAIEKKVEGYVTKDADFNDLKTALLNVIQGGKYFCKEVRPLLNSSFYFQEEIDEKRRRTQILTNDYKTLTRKEQEVFLLLLKGKSTREIADELSRTKSTIENQRNSIYRKLDVHSRGEIMIAGKELGLI